MIAVVMDEKKSKNTRAIFIHDVVDDPCFQVCGKDAQWAYWFILDFILNGSSHPGFILTNGRKPNDGQLARICASNLSKDCLAELVENGVLSVFGQGDCYLSDGERQEIEDWFSGKIPIGTIYNRRAVRERIISEKRSIAASNKKQNNNKGVASAKQKQNKTKAKPEQAQSKNASRARLSSFLSEKEISSKEDTKKKQESKWVYKSPPSLDDVRAYFLEKSFSDPDRFYDYFSEGKWIDSEGKKVYNWKQKAITWNSRSNNNPKNTKLNYKPPPGALDPKPISVEDYTYD